MQGTIATSGGYIAGSQALVDRARFHLGQQGAAHNSDKYSKQLLHGR
jgi:cystathionine beta-lyase family protein involved in aluminum resistance